MSTMCYNPAGLVQGSKLEWTTQTLVLTAIISALTIWEAYGMFKETVILLMLSWYFLYVSLKCSLPIKACQVYIYL